MKIKRDRKECLTVRAIDVLVGDELCTLLDDDSVAFVVVERIERRAPTIGNCIVIKIDYY